MNVQWLLQKFTSCCIARDLRMLHIKMVISIVYFMSLRSNPIIGLIEFISIFFSILLKFSNW